jgi:hypothetical protein
MPETVAVRLRAYIEGGDLLLKDRIFPVCYSTARSLVKKLGDAMKMEDPAP